MELVTDGRHVRRGGELVVGLVLVFHGKSGADVDPQQVGIGRVRVTGHRQAVLAGGQDQVSQDRVLRAPGAGHRLALGAEQAELPIQPVPPEELDLSHSIGVGVVDLEPVGIDIVALAGDCAEAAVDHGRVGRRRDHHAERLGLVRFRFGVGRVQALILHGEDVGRAAGGISRDLDRVGAGREVDIGGRDLTERVEQPG